MESEKTFRIGMLCTMIVVLGFFVFLFKIDACKSSPATCKDEFMAFESHSNPTCAVGAIAEVITSPPSPKSGIICHCPKTVAAPHSFCSRSKIILL